MLLKPAVITPIASTSMGIHGPTGRFGMSVKFGMLGKSGMSASYRKWVPLPLIDG